jgi:UPF0755 protein
MKLTWKILLAVSGLFLVLGIILSYNYFRKELGRPGSLNENKVIEIAKGTGIKEAASQLASENIIKNEYFFELYVLLKKKNINPGFYEITPGMSMLSVIDLINDHKIKLVKVTFPEGWRAEQMAAKLDELKIVDYKDFLTAAENSEGKLFPDTYMFNPKMEADEIVSIMTENFAGQTNSLEVSDEDLTIASIVEREAVKDEERPIIAGIYKNRLKKGMKLEADPTVQYGKDNIEFSKIADQSLQVQFKFWKPIKMADYLAVDSPYNTYLIKKLPPSPICNPGIASIEATINYTHHNYLYFLQNDGKIYPSETAAQHDYYRQTILGAKIK